MHTRAVLGQARRFFDISLKANGPHYTTLYNLVRDLCVSHACTHAVCTREFVGLLASAGLPASVGLYRPASAEASLPASAGLCRPIPAYWQGVLEARGQRYDEALGRFNEAAAAARSQAESADAEDSPAHL